MNSQQLVLKVCFLVVALGLPAYPAVIFDNADPPLSTSIRNSSIEGVAAYLQIGGSNVTIGQIAIDAQPLQNGQLKFVLFSDTAPPGSNSGVLLFNDTVNVSTSSSLAYIFSDPFSFTLLAGHYYDIGAIFSGTDIDYTYDLTSDADNGITSIVSNQNVDNFTNPVLFGHGVSDVNIRLYSPTATMPEPATATPSALGLVCAGLAGYLCYRRKR